MAQIIEKDLVKLEAEEGTIGYTVKKQVLLFCGLTPEKMEIFHPEEAVYDDTIANLTDALPKINDYILWHQTSEKFSTKLEKKNPSKITEAFIGLDEHGFCDSIIRFQNDKGKSFQLETHSKEIVNLGFDN
jgi:dihydroorotase